jgi:hypothetical protein
MRTQLRYTSCVPDGKGVYAPGHLTEEEVYDIFRQIFHSEEDALAATI